MPLHREPSRPAHIVFQLEPPVTHTRRAPAMSLLPSYRRQELTCNACPFYPAHSASAPIMPLYLMDGINHPRQGPPVCPRSPTVNVWYGHGWRYIANAGGRRHPPPLLIPSTLCTSSWPRRPAFVHDWTGPSTTPLGSPMRASFLTRELACDSGGRRYTKHAHFERSGQRCFTSTANERHFCSTLFEISWITV